MIATQIFKHIDNDQPIRFLIAECEQPISIFSALYLAKKLDIHKKIDISLFSKQNTDLNMDTK